VINRYVGNLVSWIQKVTQDFGQDILRMKGIIAMLDDDRPCGPGHAHASRRGGSQRPWKPGEKRDSRLVFIGRGLPKDRLKQGFESCRV